MPHRFALVLTAIALIAVSCGDSTDPVDAGARPTGVTQEESGPISYGIAPTTPSGPVDPAIATDLNILSASLAREIDRAALQRVAEAGDPRVAWLFSDLLRFTRPGDTTNNAVLRAWETVTGRTAIGDDTPWGNTTNHLLAWDLEAPPGYVNWKRQTFELIEPAWADFFDDDEATIDWRWVSWGGVRIDDRPLDATDEPCPRGCIPALNDPALTDAEGGDWYRDDDVVFGIVVDGEAVAFPRNIMEVHEMVNMTVAGRRIGMPYCTLCGSAQAYFTDEIADDVDLGEAETYELRTSGLLSRSNKVMFEFHTRSVFDTFTGEALSGPLREAAVQLEQITVQVATWGSWKAAHPETRIVAEDGGIGRSYDRNPLRGRDDNGPIFPIGDVDDRLGVQAPIVGVVLGGSALAFPVADIRPTIEAGLTVELAGVEITSDGGGFVATSIDTGEELPAHQAFWFAWSQFHPDTAVWAGWLG